MKPRLASHSPAVEAERAKSELRKIRLGCTKLGLSDDDRRDLMQRLANVRSSTQLTAVGRRKMLDYLARQGAFKGTPRSSYPEGHPRMARALWMKLAHDGVIRNGSDRALDAFVQKQTGRRVSSARFLTDPAIGSRIVEALKSMAARGGGDG
ncbi:regulatory protein GemA [Mesorhizobium sp. KR1-2]|uniref:regulatory protein GemA n=1 Tax=Mesorhizobium sp. KR1-2 TaxID=3156609 RepID=UPI0032B3877E